MKPSNFFVLINFLCLALILFSGCTKKEVFKEPGIILKAWSGALERLDYSTYRNCEAYPKAPGVFTEIYRDYYFDDINVISIEDLDRDDVRTDFEGNRFVKRNVVFECAEVKRSKREKIKRVRGEVFFIKFTEGNRSKEGWLMANRTIVRIPELENIYASII